MQPLIKHLEKKMFHKTIGGDYQDNDSNVSYTFPEGAVFEINDVSIPLGKMMVDCYGGNFDPHSTKHFTHVSSLLSPQKYDTYNTSIFINDKDISGDGYPTRDDFIKYGMEYLSRDDFLLYQAKVYQDQLPFDDLKKLVKFFHQWAADNRSQILKEIQSIVNSNDRFPKNLSVVYDDRLLNHTTHIILAFESSKSPTSCVLHIDNTFSPMSKAFKNKLSEVANQFNIDLNTCIESISDDNSKFIKIYTNDGENEEPSNKFEFNIPVNRILFNSCYKRMKEVLKKWVLAFLM